MNGFVVTYLSNLDDIPVLFTGDEATAEAKRDELLKHYRPLHARGTIHRHHHPDVEQVLTLTSRDCSSFNGIAVGVFAEGRLIGWKVTFPED